MSFSGEVKNELCHIELNKKCCMRAELSAIFAFCGKAVIKGWDNSLLIKTENHAVIKRTATMLRLLFGREFDIEEIKKADNSSRYSILIDSKNNSILRELGLLKNNIIKFSIDPVLVHDDCCARAYLRGAFLGGGSINSPEKSYHLEFETNYYNLSRDLLRLLYDGGFELKSVVRKSNYVIYVKDSGLIGDILAVMGATNKMLELINIKIEKDVKNNINRVVNCETANITKVANAAAFQCKAIRKVINKHGLSSLPDNLRQIAELRIDNPDISLKELGEMLDPPISKSGVNHRIAKILNIAEAIKE